jgi:hypothetical protein
MEDSKDSIALEAGDDSSGMELAGQWLSPTPSVERSVSTSREKIRGQRWTSIGEWVSAGMVL